MALIVAATVLGAAWTGRAAAQGNAPVPSCDEVAASMTVDSRGLPPLPDGKPIPNLVNDVDLFTFLKGDIYASTSTWLRTYVVYAYPPVDELRARLGLAGFTGLCVQARRNVAPIETQPVSGAGWRLLAVGPFFGHATIGLASDAKGATRLWQTFGVPARLRRPARYGRELVVAYSIGKGGCDADRVTGFNIDTHLHTVDIARAPAPPPPLPAGATPGAVAACTTQWDPWTVVLAVDRAVLPKSNVVFRDCPVPYQCGGPFLVADLVRPASFVKVSLTPTVVSAPS